MNICTITEAANKHITNLCEKTPCHAVRLSLKGGGCAGFEYKWDTIQKTEVQDTDSLIGVDSGFLAIDEMSQPFLQGTEIDYVTEVSGSRMEIRNPNAVSACGCGTSVSF